MKNRGFTLVEVTLAASLGLLLLGLVTTAFVPMLRYSLRGSARAELMQTATRASQSLITDLGKSTYQGITLPTPTTQLVAIHPKVGLTDTGLSVWDSRLIVYQWDPASRDLSRFLWPPEGSADSVDSSSPHRLTADEILQIGSSPNLNRRMLARGILRDFQLAPTQTGQSLPLHLQMSFEVPVPLPGQPPQQFGYAQDFTLRNGDH